MGDTFRGKVKHGTSMHEGLCRWLEGGNVLRIVNDNGKAYQLPASRIEWVQELPPSAADQMQGFVARLRMIADGSLNLAEARGVATTMLEALGENAARPEEQGRGSA